MPDPTIERDILRAGLIVAASVCAILAVQLHGARAERDAANAHVLRLLDGALDLTAQDRDHL